MRLKRKAQRGASWVEASGSWLCKVYQRAKERKRAGLVRARDRGAPAASLPIE